jgi:hypothetical protein
MLHLIVMRILVLYRPKSEHGRMVERFVKEYQDEHTGRLEVLDVDSRDGSATATLYDVMQYPAILAVANDGSILKSWEGETLPMMNELAYYAYNGGESVAM